jgi:hypothetical protein
MTEAIFGLVGVVVGGVLSGGVGYALERRRATNAATVAARLLADELAFALWVLKIALDARRWSDVPRYDFGVDLWAEHRALLASKLSVADWIQVSAAFRRLHDVVSGSRGHAHDDPLGEEDELFLRSTHRQADTAFDRLTAMINGGRSDF